MFCIDFCSKSLNFQADLRVGTRERFEMPGKFGDFFKVGAFGCWTRFFIDTVFSRKVLDMISNGEHGWEEMLPTGIAETIKDERLFGYSRRKFLNKK